MMRSRFSRWLMGSLVLCSGLLGACVAPAPASGQERELQVPAGFRPLFNGRDFSGWTALETRDPRAFAALPEAERTRLIEEGLVAMKKFWRVEEGALVNDGEGPYLTTLDDFGDFELMIEYRTVAGADSGIYLKATPQVQIWDYTEAGGKWAIGADKGSGGLWNNPAGAAGKDPLVLADRAFGEWNQFRIRQIGATTWVWLNDHLVVDGAIMSNYWDRALPLVAQGPIQLQTHGGEIRWRNLFIKELSPETCNRILGEQAAEGFETVFNGKDFEGWAGPLDGYEVIDGTVRCRPHQGGTIYTEEEYDDFVVRMEIMIPAGGNNGLAIRYPGDGDTAYVGMCELQVLDSEHPRYAALDPRQHHGSAYGMAAAHLGYLRPAGEWNFQEVRVVGSTIQVTLNGTMILDCDLDQVTESLGGRDHPGKDRRRGHFGLAGHSDPVAFRNIKIKRLENSAASAGRKANSQD